MEKLKLNTQEDSYLFPISKGSETSCKDEENRPYAYGGRKYIYQRIYYNYYWQQEVKDTCRDIMHLKTPGCGLCLIICLCECFKYVLTYMSSFAGSHFTVGTHDKWSSQLCPPGGADCLSHGTYPAEWTHMSKGKHRQYFVQPFSSNHSLWQKISPEIK